MRTTPGPAAPGGGGTEPSTTWWTHVTQPLATDGSALNNVIRELSREAAGHGIRSAVAGSDNRGYVFPDAELLPVDFTRYLPREYLLRREQLVDTVTGRLSLGRSAVARLYRPVAEALDATSGPVIVHDGLLGAAGLATIRERHPDRPLYLYVHNSLSRSYSRSELRRFVSLCEAVICVSGSVRDAIATRLGSHPASERLAVVLNGVDTDRFSPAGGPSLDGPQPDGPPPDGPSILFVGMMTEFKGPHVLMDALRLLHGRGVDCPATFLGSFTHAEGLGLSSYEEALHQGARALGPDVRFRPFVPNTELPEVYRRHSILVVPSQFDDPCPLVLFEGMACGLAVAASRRGGIPEIGGDAVRYFDTADQLADALAPLVSDAAVRARAGDRARERALELPWSRTFEALRSIVGPG
ncbi:MAG: glycosyltransferase family 4 protein [Acidimicrobiales bacterium]